MTELKAIIKKWYDILGDGLHLDNDGADYHGLSFEKCCEYDRDLARAFQLADELGVDVHAVCLEVIAGA